MSRNPSVGGTGLTGRLTKAFNAFATAPRGSDQRRDALASMRNIKDELPTRSPSI